MMPAVAKWWLAILLGGWLWLMPAAPAAAQAAVRPLPGPVVRFFDPPAQPWLAGHRGVDLLGRPGTAVAAAMAGRVSFAAEVAGRPVVVISHGELRTTYLPVRPRVQVGEQVAAGEVIGELVAGHSCASGNCLHWGLKRGDSYLDPLDLLGGVGIRLLPASAIAAVWVPNAGERSAGGRAGWR